MREAPASWERSRNRAGWPCSRASVAPRHVPPWRGLDQLAFVERYKGLAGVRAPLALVSATSVLTLNVPADPVLDDVCDLEIVLVLHEHVAIANQPQRG